ncbi:hypothetical protein SRABI80_03532 [Peribacillus frigoritolerans]|nr:hypothetical protein SRABI80_03532 [Peribacillus frigoritolerans]
MITWTAIRNLKDTLFLYALVVFLYLLFDLVYKKKFLITRIAIMVVACLVLIDIRQWFVYLLVVLVATIIMGSLLIKKRYFSFIIISMGLITGLIIFGQSGLETLSIYTKTYSNSYGDVQLTQIIGGNIFSLPLSMGRFILGPGPIRGIFGSDAFLTFTTTGNILITLGSLWWWFVLPVFSLSLLSIKHFKQNYVLFVIIMFYWATYSYAYAGSGDTRLRAVLYVLCAIYTLPFLEKTKMKNFKLKYLALLVPLVLVGTYFSYITLN